MQKIIRLAIVIGMVVCGINQQLFAMVPRLNDQAIRLHARNIEKEVALKKKLFYGLVVGLPAVAALTYYLEDRYSPKLPHGNQPTSRELLFDIKQNTDCPTGWSLVRDAFFKPSMISELIRNGLTMTWIWLLAPYVLKKVGLSGYVRTFGQDGGPYDTIDNFVQQVTSLRQTQELIRSYAQQMADAKTEDQSNYVQAAFMQSLADGNQQIEKVLGYMSYKARMAQQNKKEHTIAQKIEWMISYLTKVINDGYCQIENIAMTGRFQAKESSESLIRLINNLNSSLDQEIRAFGLLEQGHEAT